MRKLLFVLLLSTFGLFSFGNDLTKSSTNLFTRPWSVSSYGFLIFPTVADLDAFVQFAQTKTHAEMQQYITDSLTGFSSLGSSMYSNNDNAVTETEAINYSMNTYRILQAHSLVYRPISTRECIVNYEFLLVMTATYLNSTTYGYLQSGTYDQYSMNKFATNPYTEGTALVTYCGLTPYGHEETTPSNCPGGELPAANRPFWGWGSPYCVQGQEFNAETNTWVTTHRNCQDYYIFWIRVTEHNTYCDAVQYGGCPQ